MTLWVYICKDRRDDLVIRISPDAGRFISVAGRSGENICYVRPFGIPFDALAHKHLLGDLSFRTLTETIKKYEPQTLIWLRTLKYKK